MNPWKDRSRCQPVIESDHVICLNYPSCVKEERRLLGEVRDAGKNAPTTFTLSNGLKAVDFCLQFIMKNHFKRKLGSSKTTR